MLDLQQRILERKIDPRLKRALYALPGALVHPRHPETQPLFPVHCSRNYLTQKKRVRDCGHAPCDMNLLFIG